MSSVPRVCILRTDGTNCDQETAHAFTIAGAESSLVHVNQLREKVESLDDYEILALPGGFANGDDVASGQILANELLSKLRDPLEAFVAEGKLIIGICNGFQVLVRTGLLPFGQLGEIKATLTDNTSGQFGHRWVEMVVERQGCVFLSEETGQTIELPVAHGEGRFFAEPEVLQEIERQGLVVLRYSQDGYPTSEYPANPNGALNAIAGLRDPSGRIFGLMPHPERFVDLHQHPNWRRNPELRPDGLPFFKSAVAYAAQL